VKTNGILFYVANAIVIMRFYIKLLFLMREKSFKKKLTSTNKDDNIMNVVTLMKTTDCSLKTKQSRNVNVLNFSLFLKDNL
jgi:hypothetical protein